MKKLTLLLTLFLCASASLREILPAAKPHQQGASRPPNILFLFADDQAPDTIAAFGHPHVVTPALDSIVERGYRFKQNYCLGSNSGAVCMPSRAMVNSGRVFFKINNQLKGITTLGEILQKAGYTTFSTGKWHNGAESWERSFTRGDNVMIGGMSDHTKVPVRDLQPDGKLGEVRTGEKFSSELFADAAVDFLKSANGDTPFYMYVAFTSPHDPRQPEGEYLSMYDPETIPLPANYKPQHPFFNGWMTGRDESLLPWPRPKGMVKSTIAEYYGMITHLDHQIGRVLEALEKSGKADNTIIVYSADHGLAVGSHGLLGKQNVYEHSMGCPLVFAGPGIPHGESKTFTYLLDLFPTIAGLAGAEVPPEVDGHDLAPVWRGEKESVRDRVALAYEKYMRSIRDERWKIIRYCHINKTQLFDLTNDPDELNDLAADPAHAERIANMMKQLEAWQQEVGDDLPLTTDTPADPEIDLTGRERKPDKWQPQFVIDKYF